MLAQLPKSSPVVRWSGPLVTAALVGVVWALEYGQVVPLANPMMIFILGVTYAALVGGLWPGLTATGIAIAGFGLIVATNPVLANLGRLPARFIINISVSTALAVLIAELRRRIIAGASAPVREEQDVFQALMGTLHDAILECDWQGVRDVNASFCRMTGFTRDELVGCRPPFPFWPMEEYATMAAALEHAMRGHALDFELVLSRKNGERFPVLLSVTRITDGEAANRIIYSFRDITELKKVQASLAESQLHFKTALQAANMSSFEADPGRNMVRPSAALARLVGVGGSEAISLEQVFAVVHEADRAGFRAALERCFAAAGSEFRMEFRVAAPDGSFRWLLSAGQMLRDGEGKAEKLYGMTWDITDRRAQEEAAQAGEARLSAALAAARMATWDWDLATGEVRGSPPLRELHDLPLGKAPWAIAEFFQKVHGDDIGRVRAAVAQTVAEGTPFRMEYRVVRGDGQMRWLASHGMGTDIREGKARRMTGVAVDITLEHERAGTAG